MLKMKITALCSITQVLMAAVYFGFTSWDTYKDIPMVASETNHLLLEHFTGCPLSTPSGNGVARNELIRRYASEAKACFFGGSSLARFCGYRAAGRRT